MRVVAVSGELDIDTMVEFGAALDDRRRGRGHDRRRPAPADLHRLPGVSGLLAAARRAQEAGRRLVCVPGPASIQRIFQMTGVDTVLEWVEGPGDLG